MYTMYIILLCLSYYHMPTVISVDEWEDFMLWFNKLKYEDKDYITFESLKKTYACYEVDQHEEVFEKYSNVVSDNGQSERRLYIDKFKMASMDGVIHRYHSEPMTKLFFEIIGNKAQRGYIIHSDLENHYKDKILLSQIDTVMTTYGEKRKDGYRLGLFGFRRACNTLSIPDW